MEVRVQTAETIFFMILITISGGLQDAYSYFIRSKVFANGQTGNIVLLSVSLARGDIKSIIKYIIPIIAFMLGIFIVEQIKIHLSNLQKIHYHQIILLIEIFILFIVGLLPISDKLNPLANALSSFVCALQVQSFRKVMGDIYASTMCIGNMRVAMESLSRYAVFRDMSNFRKGIKYIFIIFIFMIGALLGGVLAPILEIRMIWISCFLLSVAFILIYMKERV